MPLKRTENAWSIVGNSYQPGIFVNIFPWRDLNRKPGKSVSPTHCTHVWILLLRKSKRYTDFRSYLRCCPKPSKLPRKEAPHRGPAYPCGMTGAEFLPAGQRPPPLCGPPSLTFTLAPRPPHNARATLKPEGASGGFFTAFVENARAQSHN